MENLSLDISLSRNSFSRDLLQRFMGSGPVREEEEEEEDEEIELNLGLSLGGKFGVDKSSTKLARSSSVASCLPAVKDDDNDASAAPPPAAAAYTCLRRTSSLPVETEEEWRKRKELQTLRRMEAKRRRFEKQRNLRAEICGVNRSGSLSLDERKEIEVNSREKLCREKAMAGALKRSNSSQFIPANLPTSQGGGSSSSDRGSKSIQVSGLSGELSPASVQSVDPSKKPNPSKIRTGQTGTTSSKEEMPSVYTRGDGPNGRRVDGILYKYGKGIEVGIMCVCHGTFHSPAEFVRHAGRADVDNPLKHIVINSSSSPML